MIAHSGNFLKLFKLWCKIYLYFWQLCFLLFHLNVRFFISTRNSQWYGSAVSVNHPHRQRAREFHVNPTCVREGLNHHTWALPGQWGSEALCFPVVDIKMRGGHSQLFLYFWRKATRAKGSHGMLQGCSNASLPLNRNRGSVTNYLTIVSTILLCS